MLLETTEEHLERLLSPDFGDLAFVANRSEEHTSELQSLTNLVCRLLLEKKKNRTAKVYDCFIVCDFKNSVRLDERRRNDQLCVVLPNRTDYASTYSHMTSSRRSNHAGHDT